MSQTVILSGEPKSTQTIYRSACNGRIPTRYMTAEGKALKEQYQWEAKAQWRGKPLEGDIAVDITLYFGTKRKADWDNHHKLWSDALNGIVYNDDSQIKHAVVDVSYDKKRPRIEIALQSLCSP